MKNLIKLIIVIILFISAKTVNAQMDFGANIGLVVPIRTNNSSHSNGYGFSLDYRYFLSEKFAAGGHFAYYSINSGNSSIIPFSASIEYHENTNSSFYRYFGIGFGMVNSKFDDNFGMVSSSTDFAISPILGIKYPFNDYLQFNACARVNLLLRPNYIGNFEMNIGIIYTLNK